jgi:hypothetical protein
VSEVGHIHLSFSLSLSAVIRRCDCFSRGPPALSGNLPAVDDDPRKILRATLRTFGMFEGEIFLSL